MNFISLIEDLLNFQKNIELVQILHFYLFFILSKSIFPILSPSRK